MSELGRRLASAAPDDPAAEQRAWELAHAAFVRRLARSDRRATRRRMAGLAVVTAALVLAAAITSAGSVVVQLVADRMPGSAPPAQTPKPQRVTFPAGGKLLVVRGGWASLVRRGAPPRRLGPADEATFSAFGRYVAVAHGRRLTVYALDGRRVWWLAERQRVHTVRWAPDGLRIAYRTGPLLRIVDGSGERPRTLGAATGRAAAWRPGADAVLAYLRTPSVVALVDVATGEDVARVRPPARTRTLAWSPDGRRLLAVGPHELRLFDRHGRSVRTEGPPAGQTFAAATFAPHGHRIARRLAPLRGSPPVVWQPSRTAP
jgi:dipeptidyl aminopeptidase/acylaminoacyl peptidase